MRGYTAEVAEQRTRDAIEIPGLSSAALTALENVRIVLAIDQNRAGERYEAQQRREETMVAAAWTAGRADPKIASELDRFMAAIDQRLGEEGKRDASRAAGEAGRMRVPGAGPEQQAGLDLLARCFVIGRDASEKTAAWGNRVAREAQATERTRARQEERQSRGLPPEPPREGPTRGRGLGR
jgi:hypothetical protein